MPFESLGYTLHPMFAAHTFALNIAPATAAGVAARATITKTTTIKG